MQKSIVKNSKKFNEKTLIVSVDIGKSLHVGYGRCPDGKELKPFEFYNNGHSFIKFWDDIVRYKEANKLEEIVVGIESTGVYGVPLLHFLRKRKVMVVQVNPMHTKKLKELHGNSPNKTDKKDPKVIADIVELGCYLTVVIPEGVEAELRSLSHTRERALERSNILNNQLHALVFGIFPEFLEIMKDISSKTSQYLLEHMPLPVDIISCGVDKLTGIIKKISRGQLEKERAQALYESALHSVGITEGRASIVFEIQSILRLVKQVEDSIEEIERKMADYLEQVPYAKFLLSMKGIGKVTVAGLIGEFGNFAEFKTGEEVMKFAGLDLYEISSGNHKGERHISKRGRSLIRKLLYFAALNTVRKNGIMHEKYQWHLNTGMKKNKALVAIARKLLTIMFALVRHRNEYIENYYEQQLLKKAA